LAGTVTLVATQVDDYTIRTGSNAPRLYAYGTGCNAYAGQASQQVDGSWTVDWDTTIALNCTYQMYVQVKYDDSRGSYKDLSYYLDESYTVLNELEIRNVSDSPDSFSPDGDGKYETNRINFTISDNAYVTLKIFNESSVLVKTLLDGELLAAGGNSVIWDGTDGTSAIVPDGLYSYTIDAVDDLGNAAVQQVGDVLLDTRKPLDLISPEDGATLAGTVTLVATQVDDYAIRTGNYAPYFTAIGTG
ncbi:unnamed protein product, partial [marine sediment metagenome]